MLFHSVEFILGFLPICCIIFAIVPRTAGKRAALAWLALASIIFYAQWSLAHGALLVGSVGTNYLFSRAMLRTDQLPKLRQAIFILAIAANLALLGYLKYTNFLIDNINALTEANYHYVAVLAPVGISFFTFIQIGFLVDVYNRQVSRLSIVDYFLFSSFFGYVTAGPRRWCWPTASRLMPMRSSTASPTAPCRRPAWPGSARWPTRCSSISTSRAIPTWRWAPACCSA